MKTQLNRGTTRRSRRLVRARRTRQLIARQKVHRLVAHRSGRHMYAQVVGADARVAAAASTLEKDMQEKFSSGATVAAAEAIGRLIAERAKEKGVARVAFDRGGLKYHGRVRALAEGARAGGLEF